MVHPAAPASRFIALPVALALALGAVGCGIPGQMVREVTPAAIDSGLKAMDNPANKGRMENIVASPEMKSVERELITGIIDGSLATLGDEERISRINALTSRYTAGMMQGFSRQIAPQIGPLVADITRSAVRGAMSEAFKPGTSGELTTAVSSAMTRDFGPALQKVIGENLGPGIAAALNNQEVRRALGDTAHLLGREMVLGVNEGILKAQQESRDSGESSALGSLGKMASKGATIANVVTWVLAALVVVLGGLLVKLLMEARKFRSESEKEQAETRLIEEAQKASEGKPWSGELMAALEERLHVPPRRRTPPRGDSEHSSHAGR
jgi:hypothetical protein